MYVDVCTCMYMYVDDLQSIQIPGVSIHFFFGFQISNPNLQGASNPAYISESSELAISVSALHNSSQGDVTSSHEGGGACTMDECDVGGGGGGWA